MGYVEAVVDVALMASVVLTGTVCFTGAVILAMCPPREMRECLRSGCCSGWRRRRSRGNTDESVDPILVSGPE